MNDWEFGTDKEMQQAVHGARKQPMTATRLGEYVGGFTGLLLCVALLLVHFFFIEWPHPQPIKLVLGYCGSCITALFVGAQVGKQIALKLKKNRENEKS